MWIQYIRKKWHFVFCFAHILTAPFTLFLIQHFSSLSFLFSNVQICNKYTHTYTTHTHRVSLRPRDRAREQPAPHKNRPHKTPCHFD